MRVIILIFFMLIIVMLGMSFYMMNKDTVTLNFYFGQVEHFPVVLAMFFALVVGVVLGVTATLGGVFKQKREIRRIRKQKDTMEKELTNLRNLPLKDE